MPTILTIKQVKEATGLSVQTIRRLRLAGDFPCAVKLAPRRIGFFATDVDNWLKCRRGR